MGEKKTHVLSFYENFLLSGGAAIISKTAAAPIERVKLLVQNQGEMIKMGRLDKPYNGVIDCTMRTFKSEGFCPIFFFQFGISYSDYLIHVYILHRSIAILEG